MHITQKALRHKVRVVSHEYSKTGKLWEVDLEYCKSPFVLRRVFNDMDKYLGKKTLQIVYVV